MALRISQVLVSRPATYDVEQKNTVLCKQNRGKLQEFTGFTIKNLDFVGKNHRCRLRKSRRHRKFAYYVNPYTLV